MVFAHDTELSLQAAVSLANSAEPPDTLTSLAELEDFWTRFGYTGRHDRDEAELTAVQQLRPRLRELLTADRDEAVDLVNDLLAQAGAVPRLVRHDDLDWHVHVVDPERPRAERIAAETAMAMVDLSRNRSKIFCGTSCSNRAAVAAYRARRAR